MSNPTATSPVEPTEVAPWVALHGLLQPYGKCQCGCGNDAPIARYNRLAVGMIKGQPKRFIHAHGGRVQAHPARPVEERFLEYIDKGDGDSCWNWIGPIDKDGYAVFTVKDMGNRACRISFILHVGSIPSKMFVCHHCDNPRCVRPDHLFLGTTQDNTADMVQKRRHCFGERHNKAKLTATDIPMIRALRASGLSQQAIAVQYNVSQSTIGRIELRKTWNHIP